MTSRPPKRFLEFDAFRIDVEERRLLLDDRPVMLTPKAFEILLILVENSGHTLEKEDLMGRVWADTFVEDTNLNRNISTLRKVLGEDSHRPRLIRTVPKRGYRFEGDVREVLEEEDEQIVERRTRYRVSFRSHTETHTEQGIMSVLTGRRTAVVAASVAALLMIGFAWTSIRQPSGEARSVAAADAKPTATDPAVVDLYNKGRDLWRSRSAGGLHRAIIDLEQSVARAPEFALAHAALADAYAFDAVHWQKAEAAANEAIRLDPSIGQPHATIGFVRMFWQWRLTEAETHFRKAIALSPDYATAHHWYAINLAARARGADALAEITTAIELEPASVSINADLCQVLYFTRKYDLATQQCLKTIEKDPNFLNAHVYLYDIYTAREMYPEAVNAFLRAEQLSSSSLNDTGQVEKLKAAFDSGGIRAFWRKRIEMLQRPVPTRGYRIAQYYARLGERDHALRWLIRAHEERDFGMVYLRADPVNTELLSDQRILELARKMAL